MIWGSLSYLSSSNFFHPGMNSGECHDIPHTSVWGFHIINSAHKRLDRPVISLLGPGREIACGQFARLQMILDTLATNAFSLARLIRAITILKVLLFFAFHIITLKPQNKFWGISLIPHTSVWGFHIINSARRDLNPQPSASEADALSS